MSAEWNAGGDIPPPPEPPDDDHPTEPPRLHIVPPWVETTTTKPETATMDKGGKSLAERTAELWAARPVHQHLHAFARARGVAPLALLGVTLARTLAMVPTRYMLPPIVGGYGTLNHFFALVGGSGAGKGAAHEASEDAVDITWIDPISREDLWSMNLGSGEGLVRAFCHYEKGAGIIQHRESVMFYVPEVDTLTAVAARQGATLMGMLREAWSGGALSFGYADQEKALRLGKHLYRCTVVVGVQPGRCKALLVDDADGGTPQRFVWLPTTDQGAPDDPPPAPDPIRLCLPGVPPMRTEIRVCAEAVAEIKAVRVQRLRGDVDDVQGHRLYAQEKVAAGLAALDGHLTTEGITVEDWELAATIMAISDQQADDMRATLSTRSRESLISSGKAEATRELAKADTSETENIKRTSAAIRARLSALPLGEWTASAELNRKLKSGSQRPYRDQAIEQMEKSGEIQVEPAKHNGTAGYRCRLIPR